MSPPTGTINLPQNPSARRAWLTYQLRLRGLSIAALAREVGVSREALSNAMNAPSSHLEEAIAAALATKPQLLFPERFDRRGRRLSRTRAPNRSTGRAIVAAEKREPV